MSFFTSLQIHLGACLRLRSARPAKDSHCTGVRQKLLTAGEKYAGHVQVDVAGFERELDSQKKRSREALKSIDLTAGRLLGELAGQLGASNFIGYEHGSLRAEASVLALLKDGKTVDSASAGDKLAL